MVCWYQPLSRLCGQSVPFFSALFWADHEEPSRCCTWDFFAWFEFWSFWWHPHVLYSFSPLKLKKSNHWTASQRGRWAYVIYHTLRLGPCECVNMSCLCVSDRLRACLGCPFHNIAVTLQLCMWKTLFTLTACERHLIMCWPGFVVRDKSFCEEDH